MKPYQQVPIDECGEPLVAIPAAGFTFEQPHPYVKLGAPYGDKSPYFVRQGVLERLMQAQALLQQRCAGWQIQIFDAYRPIAVQQFMVDHAFMQVLKQQGFDPEHPEQLGDRQLQEIWTQVYQFWARPNLDPATPPPHSTGAAVDVTLVDAQRQTVDMGSPIDELSPRSFPSYFAPGEAGDEGDRTASFDRDRTLLAEIMTAAGFLQHPNEWWHFSVGDQLWAWLMAQNHPKTAYVARYGRV